MSEDVPWADDEASRVADERRVAALVGRRILRVRYFEVDGYGDGVVREPGWHAEGFDALDFGLELDLDDGITWSFIWLQAGGEGGLLAYEGTLVPRQLSEGPGVVWDVGDRSGWPALLGRPITGVTGVWEPSEYGGPPSRLWAGGWVLRFDDDRSIVLTLGRRAPEGGFWPSSDDVAVFFSTDAARRAGVRLPGDPVLPWGSDPPWRPAVSPPRRRSGGRWSLLGRWRRPR